MRYRNSMLFGKDFILLYLNVILIISSIEKNRSSIKYSELIEGEAYGLRAFAHGIIQDVRPGDKKRGRS